MHFLHDASFALFEPFELKDSSPAAARRTGESGRRPVRPAPDDPQSISKSSPFTSIPAAAGPEISSRRAGNPHAGRPERDTRSAESGPTLIASGLIDQPGHLRSCAAGTLLLFSLAGVGAASRWRRAIRRAGCSVPAPRSRSGCFRSRRKNRSWSARRFGRCRHTASLR